MDAQHLPALGFLAVVSEELSPFPVKLVVTLVAHSICTRVQLADGDLCFALCFLCRGDARGGSCPRQPNPILVDATALCWGVTSTQVWLDITTLWVQSSPQRWALLLARPSAIGESIPQLSPGQQYQGVCLFNEAGLGAALLLAQE